MQGAEDGGARGAIAKAPWLRNALPVILVGATLVWHGGQLLDRWETATRERHARDFASYFYAARVAFEGGNPYSQAELSAAAWEDGTRRSVYPYLYPPAFLPGMAWTLPMELGSAYRLWFWISEGFGLLSALLLWLWWRRGDVALPVFIVTAFGLSAAVTQNHLMGQMNLAVLALALAATWQVERNRSVVGGILLGAACVMKMSPVLLLAWWILRRRWRAAISAIAAGAFLSVLAILVVGVSSSLCFVRDVLPGFASGDYHELRVPIDLFGNHSLANIAHQIVRGTGDALSSLGLMVSVLAGLIVLGVTSMKFRKAPCDDLATAGQVSAVMVAMLLLPLYTFEHHLVWALPAVVVSATALWLGRVSRGWSAPLIFALVVLALDLGTLRWLAFRSIEIGPGLADIVRESKTVALLILWVLTIRIGSRSRRSP